MTNDAWKRLGSSHHWVAAQPARATIAAETTAQAANTSGADSPPKSSGSLTLLVSVGWNVRRPPAVRVACPWVGLRSPARSKETLISEYTITTTAPITPSSTQLW